MLLRVLTAFSLAVVVALTTPAFAQDATYAVTGVPVDVTAANAAKAREQAFIDVQRIAYQRLMERLVPASEHARVPQPSPMEIEALVRDVIVEREKASAVRYIGTFTVRFKPEAVRGVLASLDLPVVERRRVPLVIVPVMVTPEARLLWDEPNPWRQAWGRLPSDGLIPVIVPLGELADLIAVNTDQAMVQDGAALAAIAARHATTDALVAVATLSPGASGAEAVDVAYAVHGAGVPLRGDIRVDGKPGEAREALLRRAADAVLDELREGYKQESIASGATGPAQVDQAEALLPLSGGMAEWLALRERLNRLPLLKGYDVVSLNRHEAALTLHYVGGPAHLQASLTQAGFVVAPGEGNVWLIRPAGPGSGPIQ